MSLPLSCMCTRWRWKRPLKWFYHCLLSVSRVISWLTSLNDRLVHTLCIHSGLRWIKSSNFGRSTHSKPFVLTIPNLPRPWSQCLHLSLIFFPQLCYSETVDMFLKLFFIIINVSCSRSRTFDMFVLLRYSGAGNLWSKSAIIFVLIAETLSHLFNSTFSLFVPLQMSFIGSTLLTSGWRLWRLLLVSAYLLFKWLLNLISSKNKWMILREFSCFWIYLVSSSQCWLFIVWLTDWGICLSRWYKR